jgi:hypothetical protein
MEGSLNSRDPTLKVDFALHPITSDENATLSAMLSTDSSARIMLMPTHHISQEGDMMGFRYECNAHLTGSHLPISRCMFFGHTATECIEDDTAILKLMSEHESNKRKMAEFIEELKANYNPPELSCIPDNATTISNAGLMQATDLRSVDCKPWTPEVPESIGLYHAYIRGYNRDVRVHKLFIVCSGGCPKAADQFCNLAIDVGGEWTVGEIADSEEVWWLRRACQRARCRLISMLATKFGIKVACVDDVQAYFTREGALLAVPTTDTVEHDISKLQNTTAVHNLAVDTTRLTNGILCQMHPSEGYWLFRGAQRGTGVHGAMFGSHHVCGAFPTRSPLIPSTARNLNVVVVQDGPSIIREKPSSGRQHYACFDEAFFKNLERMQWNRDNGVVELIPIVVGMQ